MEESRSQYIRAMDDDDDDEVGSTNRGPRNNNTHRHHIAAQANKNDVVVMVNDDDSNMLLKRFDNGDTKQPYAAAARNNAVDYYEEDEGDDCSTSSSLSSSEDDISSRGDSSVGSDDWPIEADHLCYELESNNLHNQNRQGDVLELRSNFVRERDVPRILRALEQNTSIVTADLGYFSFSKLQPASQQVMVSSICALPGLRTLYFNHFHSITTDMVNAIVDGLSQSRRKQDVKSGKSCANLNSTAKSDDSSSDTASYNKNRKRKANQVEFETFSNHPEIISSSNSGCHPLFQNFVHHPETATLSFSRTGEDGTNVNAQTDLRHNHDDNPCRLRSLRIRDCGFDHEVTANLFWERASATLSASVRLLEFTHATTPLSAYSFNTFLRSCARHAHPKLRHLHLTSDVVSPNMLSWSLLSGGIMSCRQSLQSFTLQKVEAATSPVPIVPTGTSAAAGNNALGYTMGRTLLAGTMIPPTLFQAAVALQPPAPFDRILSLFLPVLATFPQLKTLRLRHWHLDASDASLLARSLADDFKALQCLDLNYCDWEDPMLLHVAVALKSLSRLHVYATEPTVLHLHSLSASLPLNSGSLKKITVGGLSETLQYPFVLETIAWYVRLNRTYSRSFLLDPTSSISTCLHVLWQARNDLPALYHLLREAPNLTAIMEECIGNVSS